MRVFSKFEKKFLEQIVNLEKGAEKILKPHSFFGDLLSIKSQVTIVGRDNKYKLLENENHYFKIEIKGKKSSTSSDYFEITRKFYEANDLLNYLLQNGYLLRHEGGNALGLLINPLDFSKEKEDIETIDVYINKPLSNLLEKCSYYYQPTEALRDLVNHGFKTKSERNNRITRIISIAAVIISLISTIINLNEKHYFKPLRVDNTMKIDSTSINYFINKLHAEETDTFSNFHNKK
ncbi:hypothetical protein [Flavobacterium sp.]|uniref:hypothetical protein n=1 Tax=Flavobacterium sp. TaxID=239 RepID=UPI00263032E0|nr:hypothetical protein [Flavobacterium sp.]MDD2987286.1 hypothetical protein [Flavobacterium sp.]